MGHHVARDPTPSTGTSPSGAIHGPAAQSQPARCTAVAQSTRTSRACTYETPRERWSEYHITRAARRGAYSLFKMAVKAASSPTDSLVARSCMATRTAARTVAAAPLPPGTAACRLRKERMRNEPARFRRSAAPRRMTIGSRRCAAACSRRRPTLSVRSKGQRTARQLASSRR